MRGVGGGGGLFQSAQSIPVKDKSYFISGS
jgi:hypothetical protein